MSPGLLSGETSIRCHAEIPGAGDNLTNFHYHGQEKIKTGRRGQWEP